MKKIEYNFLPKTVFDLGELPDGNYVGVLMGVNTASQSNNSLICSFSIEIPLKENGFNRSGKVKKYKPFYKNGETFLRTFLQEFEAIGDDGVIDWTYFRDNIIPVYVTLETNEEKRQYVTEVFPRYEDDDEGDGTYEYEEED